MIHGIFPDLVIKFRTFICVSPAVAFRLNAKKYAKANIDELGRKPNNTAKQAYSLWVIIMHGADFTGLVPVHRSTLGCSLLLHNCA